jgi:hypothetical protein
MIRRYPKAMRLYPSVAIVSAALLIIAGEAAAQVQRTASASARIVERPIRIVAADIRGNPRVLPPQAQLSQRPCERDAPPGCRIIVIELP